MKRDILITPLGEDIKLITATDCSGAVGENRLDIVNVPNEILAYFTARVAFMEVMSVDAKPVFYTVSNFINDGYEHIHKGIKALLNELDIKDIQHITSSETNFEMVQSALGISVSGILNKEISDCTDSLSFACVGWPLVGNEVVENPEKILSASMFARLANDEKAVQILPVGSKGIAYKLKEVFDITAQSSKVDLYKSAGPSTCVILGYNDMDENYFIKLLGELFHPIVTEC
jgi:hypothetical protein